MDLEKGQDSEKNASKEGTYFKKNKLSELSWIFFSTA